MCLIAKKKEEVNFKCTLEMLQPELWLVAPMRKCSGLFHPASPSLQTHGLIFLFFFLPSFNASVCLFVWPFFFKILFPIFCNSHSWRSLEMSPKLPDLSLLDVFLFTLVNGSIVCN